VSSQRRLGTRGSENGNARGSWPVLDTCEHALAMETLEGESPRLGWLAMDGIVERSELGRGEVGPAHAPLLLGDLRSQRKCGGGPAFS